MVLIEIWELILTYLSDSVDIYNFSIVCTRCNNVFFLKSKVVWLDLLMRIKHALYGKDRNTLSIENFVWTIKNHFHSPDTLTIKIKNCFEKMPDGTLVSVEDDRLSTFWQSFAQRRKGKSFILTLFGDLRLHCTSSDISNRLELFVYYNYRVKMKLSGVKLCDTEHDYQKQNTIRVMREFGKWDRIFYQRTNKLLLEQVVDIKYF